MSPVPSKQPVLKAHTLTCIECDIGVECEACKITKPTSFSSKFNINESENEVQPFIDDADTGVTVTDGEDQEDGDADTDEMGMYCGAVVWAKYGKFWYPGKVVSLETVPTNIRKKLPSTENKYVISWFGESNFSAIAKDNVEMLARNKSDKARAEQSVNIGKKYLMALAEQMDENEATC